MLRNSYLFHLSLVNLHFSLRDFGSVKTKDQVALVGMGSKFELWNLENWERKQAGLQVEGEDTSSDLPPSLEEIPL